MLRDAGGRESQLLQLFANCTLLDRSAQIVIVNSRQTIFQLAFVRVLRS